MARPPLQVEMKFDHLHDAQAVVAVKGGAWKMVEHLGSVVTSGWRFNRVLFETHGRPRIIGMGEDGIDAR
jgi:hypothetical protein